MSGPVGSGIDLHELHGHRGPEREQRPVPPPLVVSNPDTFRIDGKKVDVPEEKRHELLLKTIRECMKPSFDSEISTANIVYLYYDGAEVREEMLI